MESYWLVAFKISYIDIEGSLRTIKGNSAHELPNDSFLPGSVKKALMDTYLKKIVDKILDPGDIGVTITFFGRIDTDGYDDFWDERNTVDHNFHATAREFVQKTRVVTIKS